MPNYIISRTAQRINDLFFVLLRGGGGGGGGAGCGDFGYNLDMHESMESVVLLCASGFSVQAIYIVYYIRKKEQIICCYSCEATVSSSSFS